MPGALNDAARAALSAGHLAHLVTINPDGSPQVTCVWVGVEGDEIVSAHLMTGQKKLANLRNDPRVAISVETGGLNPMGLAEYLIVNGTATVVDGGAPELLQHLAHTYLGPGVKFPPMDNPPAGFVLRIGVDRVGGVGPW